VFDVARLAQALIAWLDDCGIRTANAGRELVGLPDRTARAGHSLEGINLTRPSESVAVGGATIDAPGVARDGALVPEPKSGPMWPYKKNGTQRRGSPRLNLPKQQ
jgi:hypothetical protein